MSCQVLLTRCLTKTGPHLEEEVTWLLDKLDAILSACLNAILISLITFGGLLTRRASSTIGLFCIIVILLWIMTISLRIHCSRLLMGCRISM